MSARIERAFGSFGPESRPWNAERGVEPRRDAQVGNRSVAFSGVTSNAFSVHASIV
jgi:hypothetical protein